MTKIIRPVTDGFGSYTHIFLVAMQIWSCARSGDWQQRYKAWILGRGIYNFKLDSAHIQGQTPEEQVLRYNYWWSVWNLKQVHYCQNLSGYRRWGSCSDICDGSPSKHGRCFGETDCSNRSVSSAQSQEPYFPSFGLVIGVIQKDQLWQRVLFYC